MLARALAESTVVSGACWIDDGLAFVAPWGFGLEDIATPVAVWASELDVLVPVAQARYLASRIPGSELHVAPGREHALDDPRFLRGSPARECQDQRLVMGPHGMPRPIRRFPT